MLGFFSGALGWGTSSTMAGCRLDVLGSWRLADGQSEIDVRGRKYKALFTFLAFEQGRSHSREKLAHLLWGDVDDARARASLRQCLVGLRASLNTCDARLHDDSDLGLKIMQDSLTIDASEVIHSIADTLPSNSLVQTAHDLSQLLHNQRGLSPAFDDWIAGVRTHCVSEAQTALKERYSATAALSEDRIEAARAALVLDPLHEEAVRAVMECKVRLGNAASALRFYDTFHATLSEEMDAEPSLATQDLAVAIKMGSLPDAHPPRQQKIKQALKLESLRASLAVLPFEALGPGTVPRFILLGLLDRITSHLASLPAPEVISSNSTRHFLDDPPRAAALKEVLGVEYVLSGSILIIDNEAAVTVQLVETQAERVIWASTFNYAAEDLLALRIALPEDLTRIVAPSVDLAELRRAHMLGDDALAPYQMVLRARDMIFELDADKFQRAGTLLQQAVEEGPYFSLAHLRLAEWHSLGLWEGRTHGASRDALEYHAQRALALRPGDGRALAFWAHARFMFAREHDAAIEMIERAVATSPNDAETLANCVVAMAHGGRVQEAAELADRALRLSPLDPWLFRTEHFASVAQYAIGDYNRASDLGLSSFKRSPNYLSNVRATIAALIAAERRDQAIPLVNHHQRLEPDFSVARFVPRHGFRQLKDRRLYGDRLIEAGLAH